MSVHVEWLNADGASVDLVLPHHFLDGEPADLDEEQSTGEDYCIVLGGDDAVAIHGSPMELRALVEQMRLVLVQAGLA